MPRSHSWTTEVVQESFDASIKNLGLGTSTGLRLILDSGSGH